MEPYLVRNLVGNVLYDNTAGVLSDITPANLGLAGAYQDAAWGDFDNDGDFDVYLCGLSTPNRLFSNDGGGVFTDATEESGLGEPNRKFTLASIWDDFDGDGDLDLYVVNDFGRNNLFRNDGKGRFEDVAVAANAVDVGAGMGATTGDFDLDGDPDLYVTNMWSAPGLRIASQTEAFMGGAHRDVHQQVAV